jgi:hypothetical protein
MRIGGECPQEQLSGLQDGFDMMVFLFLLLLKYSYILYHTLK